MHRLGQLGLRVAIEADPVVNNGGDLENWEPSLLKIKLIV
jgi:hypothetical protein